MTYQKNNERREAIWNYFKDYFDMAGVCPSMRECGDVIGASKSAVKHYIMGFERDGKMKIVKRKVYFTNEDGTIIEPRKGHSEKVSKQKAEAGRAGAEALKRLAIETGVERFTAGMGRDEATIRMNIERIVAKAEKNGTLYHPRPKLVVLIGEKVG